MLASTARKGLHGKTFEYDTNIYPFKRILENLYGCELEKLHLYLGDFGLFERNTDQSTLAHKVFYSSYHRTIKPLYVEFLESVITKIVPYPFYYQTIPTFRIGLPGNRFVGEYHTDAKYNHQTYELNFNLGLANYVGDAALKAQRTPGSSELILLECPYGKIFSFDHIDCMHGSDINTSDSTMVSFDFRLALKDLYYESQACSVNMSTKFAPGSYFSLDPLGLQ